MFIGTMQGELNAIRGELRNSTDFYCGVLVCRWYCRGMVKCEKRMNLFQWMRKLIISLRRQSQDAQDKRRSGEKEFQGR